MPDPISSTPRSAYETCNPSNASCLDLPSAPPNAGNQPPVVMLEPVVIVGDAGAQELLRRYAATPQCLPQQQNAAISCMGITLGVISAVKGGLVAGLPAAFHASLACGKDLRSIYDCDRSDEALRASLVEVIADCHERDGVVKPGSVPTEIICEVER
ncbi:MAG TPA: hypothetical protein VEQ59_08895 [Polyangiaceae bacterium]|nr:hypothetical protein [Polyangiaceae bacterium]